MDLVGKAKRVRLYVSEGDKIAADVMTEAPITVEERTPLPHVAEIMSHRRLKRLPVVDEQGALVGIVSRVDLLRTVAGGHQRDDTRPRDAGFSGDLELQRVMRRDFAVVHPETELAEVFQAVMSTRLNRALVVDSDRRVLGVITDAEPMERLTPPLRPSALRSLMHRLPFAHPAGASAAEHHATAQRAADLVVGAVPTATESTLVRDAIPRMLQGAHKLLAVTDADDHLVGVIDRADLLHGLVTGA